MYFIVLGFLFLSLILYVIVGGADFGIGILETFASNKAKMRSIGEKAIAPIWEANHIWLIIALVIVFVGFPKIHFVLMTTFHIPMVLMLIGIILRGTAFTFRYYQVGNDQVIPTKYWSVLFRSGSFLTPFVFGVICASLSRGTIAPHNHDFFTSYIEPWFGIFPFATGLFTITLFAWIASVFVIGEVKAHQREEWIAGAKKTTIALLVMGLLVTFSALKESNPLIKIESYIQIASVVLATAGIGFVWRHLQPNISPWFARMGTGFVSTIVVGGYGLALYPFAILTQTNPLRWNEGAAPEATINVLGFALITGSLLIIPGVIWLYTIFKKEA